MAKAKPAKPEKPEKPEKPAVLAKPAPKNQQAKAKKGDVVFVVSCDCPTELAFNPCRVAAGSPDEAKQRFMQKNGIAGTDHPISITPESEVTETDEQQHDTGNHPGEPPGADQGSNSGT